MVSKSKYQFMFQVNSQKEKGKLSKSLCHKQPFHGGFTDDPRHKLQTDSHSCWLGVRARRQITGYDAGATWLLSKPSLQSSNHQLYSVFRQAVTVSHIDLVSRKRSNNHMLNPWGCFANSKN